MENEEIVIAGKDKIGVTAKSEFQELVISGVAAVGNGMSDDANIRRFDKGVEDRFSHASSNHFVELWTR